MREGQPWTSPHSLPAVISGECPPVSEARPRSPKCATARPNKYPVAGTGFEPVTSGL